MKGAKRILRAGLLLALLPAAGCLSPHRSAVADVDPLGWREAAEVRFPNADTLAVCDLWLVVRYDAAFAGSDDRRARFAPRDGAFHAAARPLARAVAAAVRYGGTLPAACGASLRGRLPDDDPSLPSGTRHRGRGGYD